MRTVTVARKLFCIATVFGVTSAAYGQVQEEWVARYNGAANGSDTASVIAVDSAGNVYVTGSSVGSGTHLDYATLKYDSDGNQLWERRYDGSYGGASNRPDFANALAVDSAGNVYVTGDSYGSHSTLRDYATLKYDSDGNLLWTRRYNGPGSSTDQARAIAVDSEGNVYVTGNSVGSGTGHDYATLKYDTDGILLWESRYNGGGSGSDAAFALALDSAGNVYVTGGTGSYPGRDYATLKYDTDGNLLWARRYAGSGGAWDIASHIAVDSAGNVYVTGESTGSGTDLDYATLKYDPDGNLLWASRYNRADYADRASALAVDNAGNVYVIGLTWAPDKGWDYATVKYDSNGNQLWDRRSDGPGFVTYQGADIEIDTESCVYVNGYSPVPGIDDDYVTLKYDPSGNVLWEMRYNGPGNGSDRAHALALDSAGNVYVTGESTGSGTGTDYATIKYSQTQTILPDSFSVFRGMLTGGGLSDLLASDDSWMTVLPGITLNQAERQVQLIVVGTAPTETPSELRIRVEAHAEINNIGQWIELWNYDTSSWEEVDFMIATTTDSIVEVSITVDPGRFVQAGTKEMKAKISYKEAGIVLSFPWLISFDQTVWAIVP
ncbi:MAG: SBBP repeat-containing protein [Armatimonadetes bacterium]|nr:SBBP repeat-containing protein [Armatimonadota bacterium]